MKLRKIALGLVFVVLGACDRANEVETQKGATNSESKPFKNIHTRADLAVNLNRGLTKSCSAILQGNIYDKQRLSSSFLHYNKFQDWFCSESFSSASEAKERAASLDIPIPKLSGVLGLDLSDDNSKFQESRQKLCQQSSAENYTRIINSEYIEIISASIVNAFDKCIEKEADVILKQVGVYAFAYPTSRDLMTYNVDLQVRPFELGKKLLINSVEPDTVKCTYNNKDINGMQFSQTTLSFTCRLFNAETGLSFNTNMGRTPHIQLLSNEQVAIDDLRVQNAQLSAEISRRFRQLEKWPDTQGEAFSNSGVPIGWANVSMCPTGQYAAGVQVYSDEGGKYCWNCITGVKLICKPLKID